MEPTPDNFVPKVHPVTRPVEPDDPMNLYAVEVPGEPELMLRLLVEEYARMGWDLDALVGLFRDPFYVAAHGLWLHYGEEELKRRLTALLGRVGVVRTKTTTRVPPSERLVQIDLSTAAKGTADHA
ncbi:MAG: hypothetical protein HY288_04555 [Planctomycetia bacterium]|nr:hypothetical protein [Planctomycetia bacterium]